MSATQASFATSFYVVGGTVRRDALCYLQRDADSKLYKGLKQGRFCYVLTSRQMGKSSLMVQTAAHLREEGVTVAMLDLPAIGQNLSPEQWYGGLLIQLGQQLDLEDELSEFRREHMELGPLQRWMQAIRQIVLPRYVSPVIIFIDEIDAVRSLPFSTDEFFAGIRELYNQRTNNPGLERLTFCLLGVATPSDLIRDTRTTPFNVGQRIELNDFTEAEAMPFAQGLRIGEKEGAEVLKRVLFWTSGNPYLTQLLCQAVADDTSVTDSEGVDRLCAEKFFTRRARERDDNLLFVRERMLRSDVDVAGLLNLYERARRGKSIVDDEINPQVSVLRLSGITRGSDGRLQVRNRICERVFDREWVRASMRDAEVKRQRAAFRQVLLRATAVSALILILLLSLVIYAFRQRNRAVWQEQANRKLLYAAQMNLAQQAWEDGDAGRVEDLLLASRPQSGSEDLRGFEWYYLWRLSHRYSSALYIYHDAYDGYVLSVAFSPDGKRLATVSVNATVKLWDAATGQELLTLNTNQGQILEVAFSPDGKRLATWSDGSFVGLWDAATGQALHSLWSGAVMSVAFSPDGKRLASAGFSVYLWDAATGHKLLALKDLSIAVGSVAFSPDGKRLATGCADGVVKLWDTATGQELITLKVHSAAVGSLAFSLDGKRLATGSADRTVKLWDTATGQELITLKGHSAAVGSVAFSPDGKRLATASADRTVKLWDTATGQELIALKGHSKGVFSLAFSLDGKRLATGSTDRTVIWDAAISQELLTLEDDSPWVKSVAFSPDGKRLATWSWDRTVKLWDAATGQELLTLKRDRSSVKSVIFSPDGKRLAAGC